MIIYKIVNKINGKIYIGQTRSSVAKRFNQHCESRNKTVIGMAIKKHGRVNFSISALLCNIKTQEEINIKEIEYISEYNSIAPIGYNVANGGNHSKLSDESKRKISLKLKGRKVTWSKKVSSGVKRLWENKEYRERQTRQRHQKRGKYRDGIKKPLRLNLPVDLIQKMYKNGDTINKISKHFNVSFCVIKKRVNNGN